VAAARGEMFVVGDEHQRGAGIRIQGEQQVDDRLAGVRVQVARGLVGEQQRGLRDEGARQRHALLFAAGELFRIVTQALAQADLFEDAARRTAQMTYDLKFDGAPVFFSWPSKGETSLYPYDETEIEWAQGDLKRFLDDILRRPEARNVYIVAHSMGNRALTKSLGALLTEKPDFKSKVKEIILAAPDIDADTFKREIAPALVTSGCPITLYASADDFALQMSMTFHGYPRLGAGGQNRVVMPGVETVDATGVDASFLGHSYYGSVRPVLSDISGILHNGWRAAQRVTTLSQTGVPPSAYWTVKK